MNQIDFWVLNRKASSKIRLLCQGVCVLNCKRIFTTCYKFDLIRTTGDFYSIGWETWAATRSSDNWIKDQKWCAQGWCYSPFYDSEFQRNMMTSRFFQGQSGVKSDLEYFTPFFQVLKIIWKGADSSWLIIPLEFFCHFFSNFFHRLFICILNMAIIYTQEAKSLRSFQVPCVL